MGLDLSTKHLALLSLHTDHHIHEGINLHHLFWLLLPPLLIQQLRRSWCMFRHGPATASNVEKQSPQLSSALAVQQKVLICLFSHHTKHLGTNCLFFFCSTSWVRQALLITNQVNQLFWYKLPSISPVYLQIPFALGYWGSPVHMIKSFLYVKLTHHFRNTILPSWIYALTS